MSGIAGDVARRIALSENAPAPNGADAPRDRRKLRKQSSSWARRYERRSHDRRADGHLRQGRSPLPERTATRPIISGHGDASATAPLVHGRGRRRETSVAITRRWLGASGRCRCQAGLTRRALGFPNIHAHEATARKKFDARDSLDSAGSIGHRRREKRSSCRRSGTADRERQDDAADRRRYAKLRAQRRSRSWRRSRCSRLREIGIL